jgi:hypothetical protein
MGWSFTTIPSTKEDYVRRNITGPCASLIPDNLQIKASSMRGQHLWTVFEHKQGLIPNFICLFLLEKHDGCWGHKDICEEMGPFEVDCPLKFLALAPVPTSGQDYAIKWREKVKAFHSEKSAKAKRRPKVGDRVRIGAPFTAGHGEYTVQQDFGRKGLLVGGWRINARQVKYLELVAA